jgi:hypothetical protein
MKFNWPAVVEEFRKIVQEGVSFSKQDETDGFHFELRQTDRFHPFDSDGELDRALQKMPKRCDYRSLKSYWAWKNGKYAIEEALDEMLYEVEDAIRDHYSNSWNFAPGFRLPKEINFAWEGRGATPRMVNRIIKAEKRP